MLQNDSEGQRSGTRPLSRFTVSQKKRKVRSSRSSKKGGSEGTAERPLPTLVLSTPTHPASAEPASNMEARARSVRRSIIGWLSEEKKGPPNGRPQLRNCQSA